MPELDAWLASERDIAIRIRTGKVGTHGQDPARLRRLRTSCKVSDWQAGFVSGAHLGDWVPDADARWGWDGPTLACLALARRLAATALTTTDQAWRRADGGVAIEVIR